MAALALTTGSLEEAIPRLRRIAASPHWRNTFLFAAGRFFAEPQPHQKSAITELVVGIDRDAPDRLAEYVPIGPQLALEVVDDGMASEPVYLHPLLEHALTLLLGPEPTDITGFVRFIMAASATSESSRAIVVEGMRAALGAHETARKTTRTVQDHIQHHPRDEEVDPHVLSLAAVRRDASRSLSPEPIADWEALSNVLDAYAEDDTVAPLGHIGDILLILSERGDQRDVADELQQHLLNADTAFIVQEALAHVAAASPLLIRSLRDLVLPGIWRRPVVVTFN